MDLEQEKAREAMFFEAKNQLAAFIEKKIDLNLANVSVDDLEGPELIYWIYARGIFQGLREILGQESHTKEAVNEALQNAGDAYPKLRQLQKERVASNPKLSNFYACFAQNPILFDANGLIADGADNEEERDAIIQHILDQYQL